MTNKAADLLDAFAVDALSIGRHGVADSYDDNRDALVAYIEELERKAQAYDKHANRYADFRSHYDEDLERKAQAYDAQNVAKLHRSLARSCSTTPEYD